MGAQTDLKCYITIYYWVFSTSHYYSITVGSCLGNGGDAQAMAVSFGVAHWYCPAHAWDWNGCRAELTVPHPHWVLPLSPRVPPDLRLLLELRSRCQKHLLV